VRSAAVWLAVRELGARRWRVALAVLVVAATAAAATAVEFVARAREEAVAVQIDAMGPALTLVPRGATASALARLDLGDAVLPPGVEAATRAALGRDLRSVERRLVLHREVAGARGTIVGVEADALPRGFETRGAVALGSELARRLGDVSTVAIARREYRVAGVMPSTASGEDVALLMQIDGLQALSGVDGVNALRLFLRAGVSPQDAEARLARAGIGAAVIRSDRGDVADREAQESLSRHRGVAYAVMAVVAGLCLLMAAHLDAAERRVELATLVAIGASRWTVLGAILARSSLVAVVGAVIGAAAGAALAVGQDPALAAVVASAWHVSATTVAAALGLGILAAAPTAFVSSARDPVRELQEG
jgi:hypothetical protein